MTEILFILTVLFIAYIVCSFSAERKILNKTMPQDTKPVLEEPKAVIEKMQEVKPQVIIVENKVAEKAETPAEVIITEPKEAIITAPVVVTPTPVAETLKEIPATAIINQDNVIKKEIRNPKTGEISTPHGNYQFTKRWIKEALVTEGLVDKIYKSNELSSDTEAKIKQALIKLAAMDNYKV
ncbi:MAG: hypothetical protein WAX77_13160 [Methylococcaceae bacterium]